MKKNEYGVWEIVLPAVNGQPAIPHKSKIKVRALPNRRLITDVRLTRIATDLHD